MIFDDTGYYMLNGRTLYMKQRGQYEAVQRFDRTVNLDQAVAEYEGVELEAQDDTD